METADEIFDDANGDLAVGDLDSAVEKYRRCVQIAPDFFDGWHALGMALMKLGRFTEAIEAGKKAVELRPNDQIGWTSLSLFYNRAGHLSRLTSYISPNIDPLVCRPNHWRSVGNVERLLKFWHVRDRAVAPVMGW